MSTEENGSRAAHLERFEVHGDAYLKLVAGRSRACNVKVADLSGWHLRRNRADGAPAHGKDHA